MKRIDYSSLGLTEEQIKVFSREIEILTSGQERYLDHRAEDDYSPSSAVKFLTLAGWTDVRQNRVMVIEAIHNRLPDLSPRKISQMLHQIDSRFKEIEGIFSEDKIFKKKKPMYFSETSAQGKQQMVVFDNGDVFESIKAAAIARNMNRHTLARNLRKGTI